MNTEAFPEYLIVAAAGKFDPGLAVSLQFGIIKKSTISFITFIFKSPITLTGDDLIERFDQIRNLLPKDYPHPKEAFDGTIEVKILSVAEIHDALKHFHVHARTMSFPAYYLQNLEAALEINPKSDCLVACEKVY